MDLFAADPVLRPIPFEDGQLSWMPQLPLPWSNAEVMARLLSETDWREETVVVYGKRHLQPRLSEGAADPPSGCLLDLRRILLDPAEEPARCPSKPDVERQ